MSPVLEHAVVAVDGEAHATALDDRDLLVRMRVHGGDGVRRDAQAAHHHSVAPEHLTLDAVGDPLGWNRGSSRAAETLRTESGACSFLVRSARRRDQTVWSRIPAAR